MAQFYSQQAYGLWPQVWPVPEEKVIKGYEQFLYRLMFVICTVFAVTFIIKHMTLFSTSYSSSISRFIND